MFYRERCCIHYREAVGAMPCIARPPRDCDHVISEAWWRIACALALPRTLLHSLSRSRRGVVIAARALRRTNFFDHNIRFVKGEEL